MLPYEEEQHELPEIPKEKQQPKRKKKSKGSHGMLTHFEIPRHLTKRMVIVLKCIFDDLSMFNGPQS